VQWNWGDNAACDTIGDLFSLTCASSNEYDLIIE
jgi:hypothetical protein